ncbi:MAG: recombinase family protein [Endomicrobium sp.]|jgi:DNA invertase Pin-like site-specific DNA recombinase|nr:recombinase family protein [Endomicrobium sp.]
MRTRGKTRSSLAKVCFVDNQIEKCVEFAKRSGYNVVTVFREEGESGRTTDRTEFKKYWNTAMTKRIMFSL